MYDRRRQEQRGKGLPIGRVRRPTGGRVLWLGAQPAWALATRVKNALRSLDILPRNAGVHANEIFINQLTQKHRARSSGCFGRVLRPCGAMEARRSDLARTKTRSRPPISGLRRPVGEPHSPVSWSRQTPDSTNSISRSSEPARLASSWPTRKAARASHGPVGHQWRGHAILSRD